MSVTHYRCTSCEAEDLDRGNNGPAPLVLNCWKCKAGRGMDISEMLARGLGMVQVPQESQEVRT